MSTYYDTSYPPSLWGIGTSVITTVAPSTGVVGAAPTLTVTGTGFTPTTVVLFDSDPRPTTFVSETQLTATVAALVGPARTVQVTTSNGGSKPFTITAVVADDDGEPPADDDCPPETTTTKKGKQKASPEKSPS